MKRWPVSIVVVSLMLSACGDPQVVVRARLDNGPVADMPVRLLSYDWKAIRDSLGRRSDAPEPVFPQELIQQVRALDTEAAAARLRGDTALARLAGLRKQLNAQVDSIRGAQAAWAQAAYANVDTAIVKRTENTGRFEAADTTDARGNIVLKGDHGDFWVSARYTLPYSQLEWSVPVKIAKGQDSIVVELTRANATEKPSL